MKMRILFFGSIMLNLIFIGYKFINLYNEYTYEPSTGIRYFANRNVYLNQFPISSQDIVFAGDSEVDLFDFQEMFNDAHIKNRGILYDVSQGLLQRIDPIIAGKPKKIFIEIGLNDINQNVPLQTVSNNIMKMIKKIKAGSPSTLIYINSLPASNFTKNNRSAMPEIRQLNTLIYADCKLEGVTYIDLFNPLLADNGLDKKYDSGDGVHLNYAGYQQWKKALINYID